MSKNLCRVVSQACEVLQGLFKLPFTDGPHVYTKLIVRAALCCISSQRLTRGDLLDVVIVCIVCMGPVLAVACSMGRFLGSAHMGPDQFIDTAIDAAGAGPALV